MSNMTSNGEKVTGKRKASEVDEVAKDNGNIIYTKFSIRGQDGNNTFFRVNQDKYLISAFKKYCLNKNVEYGTINFMFEGKHIRGDRTTPRMLKLKDNDQIDALKHQTGGGGAPRGN